MNILDSNSNIQELSSSLLSFKDCPNHCVDGKIVDPYLHKRIICPYCADKREKFAQNGMKDKTTNKTISELLELPTSFTGNEYNPDIVLPKFARKLLKDDSIGNVLNKMQELLTDITIGKLPSCSIMFNLGKKANEINFIYPYLIRGYVSGRTLVPLVTLTDLCQLRLSYEGSINNAGLSKSYNYNDLINRDICVVMIDAGATYTSLLAVKGLIQLRGQKFKPTIVFTNQWNKYVRDICSEDDYECYHLTKLFGVEYINEAEDEKSKDKEEIIKNQSLKTNQFNQIGMSSDDLRSLMTGKNSL